MTDQIGVVLTADAGFVKQLAVTIQSIASSSRRNRDHRIFVLHDRLGAVDRQRIEELARGTVRFEWIDGHTEGFSAMDLPHRLTAASLFRLRVDELLPADVERVIYLDCDVIVCRPLDALWAVSYTHLTLPTNREV